MSRDEAVVREWNASYPPGTAVKISLLGRDLETKTTAPAKLLGGRIPVVYLEAIQGYFKLDKVSPVKWVIPGVEGN